MEDYPIGGFCFDVGFLGVKDDDKIIVGDFMEVSGISVNISTKIQDDNSEFYRVFEKVEHDSVTLKKGVFKDFFLDEWICKQINEGKIAPIGIYVMLMDELKKPVILWQFHNAVIKNWKTSGFDSMKSSLLVEEMSFEYEFFSKSLI